MRKQVTIPVTVKCRLGVDDRDKWEEIVEFIKVVHEEGGIQKFIIHARKAFLQGLNPKQNRTVPPLQHDWVFHLKKLFPHLDIIINGGFDEIEKILDVLSESNILMNEYQTGELEGCMSGRLAMNSPWEIARIDREIFCDLESNTQTREFIIRNYADFAQKEQDESIEAGWNLTNGILIRPLINLFNGEYGSGDYRKFITINSADKKNAGQCKKVILETLEYFKTINNESLQTINGKKIIKPAWRLKLDEEHRLKLEMVWSENLDEETRLKMEIMTLEESK